MGMNVGYLTANRTSAGDEVYTPFYSDSGRSKDGYKTGFEAAA